MLRLHYISDEYIELIRKRANKIPNPYEHSYRVTYEDGYDDGVYEAEIKLARELLKVLNIGT